MLVLARVAMGNREAAGAVDDAERTIEAVLSIAVGAGGVSWQKSGSSATLLDGRTASNSMGAHLGSRPHFEDKYGIRATHSVLADVSERLNAAMNDTPMPDYLVEALLALREAGMANHRDVHFYGARAVTPRFSMALQDHAMELIASFGSIGAAQLATALEKDETDWVFMQRLLTGVMAPFDASQDGLSDPGERQVLERTISRFDGESRVVSLHKAVDLREEILGLPMTALARADLTAAMEVLSRPRKEAQLLGSIRDDVRRIRERHRRVRNAVNHGNPLTTAALESVRGFAERTSRAALNMALNSYASKKSLPTLIDAGESARRAQEQGRTNGQSFIARNPPVDGTNSGER
ncbi:hypothetical protein LN996_02430 [Arthrobacter sp. AK01]|uniref:hypothetical protein n=1 Tax=Arthrobacter sp. AK01 TaxID=2894084 RepID=UPI001E53F2B3|nr:hypothetical protein [Arthrobacter sp. AK01]MCD4849662.1 hypothetical protein [Arthrobacter sp. AK01]